MDLSTLKIDNEPATLVLVHPVSGEKLDIEMQCVGLDSDQFKAVDRQLSKKRMMEAQRQGNVKKIVRSFDFDQDEEDNLTRLAACICGWKNVIENEKQVKFTKDAAVDVMKKYPWIKDQIADFVSDRANFIKAC